MPLVQIKYPNALNDSKTYFDQPVKKKQEANETLEKERNNIIQEEIYWIIYISESM